MDFPIFYDLEWSQQRNLGKQAIENIAVAFLTRIKKAGYKVGIYCNLDWYNNVLSDTLKKYDCWIARYPASDNGSVQERLRPSVGVGWQYSSRGKVSGISGNVDIDVFYKDYKEEVSAMDKAIEKVILIAKMRLDTLKRRVIVSSTVRLQTPVQTTIRSTGETLSHHIKDSLGAQHS